MEPNGPNAESSNTTPATAVAPAGPDHPGVRGTGVRSSRSLGWAAPVALCASLTGLKLWLIGAQTLSALSPSPADDGLFLAQAEALLQGEWLGPASDVVLSKGPIYALWLTAVHAVGLPLLQTQSALYAAACALAVAALRPALRTWWCAALYVALLWNPASWADGPATRLIRDGIYPALALSCLAAAAAAVLRIHRGVRSVYSWAALAGLSGALASMTREDAEWLAPAILILIVGAALAAGRARLWRVAAALLAAAATFAAPILTIAAQNRSRYGVFTTCDMKSPEFLAAYGALTRVQTPDRHPKVPVPRQARARIAEVSPAFREIWPGLERSAPGWIVWGCEAYRVCDDIGGGWFVWAFRAAVGDVGKYESLATARDYYARLAKEINAACDSGALACGPPRASLMPPWRSDYLAPLGEAMVRGVVLVSTYDSVRATPTRPFAAPADLRRIERISGERIPRDGVRARVEIESGLGEPRPVVVGTDYQQVAADVSIATREERPSGLVVYSVEVLTACTRGCAVVNIFPTGDVVVVPLVDSDWAAVAPPNGRATGKLVHWERVLEPMDRLDRARLAALDAVTHGYGRVLPLLLLVAVLLAPWVIARELRRDGPSRAYVGAALLVGAVGRIGLLGLVDVTSVPAIIVHYAAPAYPLVIGFTLLTIAAAAHERAVRQQALPTAPFR